MKREIIFLAVFLGVVCIPGAGYGAEFFGRTFEIDQEELKGVNLGVGLLYSTSPYEGKEDNVYPVPLIEGRYKNIYSDGTSLGYIFAEKNEFAFSVVGFPRLMGYEEDDSSDLNGMQDREWSLDAGLRAAWDNEFFSLAVTGLTDLFSRHQGQEFSAVISREFLEGAFIPRIGVKWWSDDLVDYYFGVVESEVRANRPEYAGDATTNFIAGFTAGLPLDDAWALVFDFEYEDFGSEVEDSPIVDADNVFRYVAGIVYRF